MWFFVNFFEEKLVVILVQSNNNAMLMFPRLQWDVNIKVLSITNTCTKGNSSALSMPFWLEKLRFQHFNTDAVHHAETN